MKNSKDGSRKISKIALEIATSIEHTAAAAHHRGEATGTAISVNAALGATREYVLQWSMLHCALIDLSLSVFIQCASFMRDVASKGPVTRYFAKGLTADTVGAYLSSVQGLNVLLKVGKSHSLAIQRSYQCADSRSQVWHYARVVSRPRS